MQTSKCCLIQGYLFFVIIFYIYYQFLNIICLYANYFSFQKEKNNVLQYFYFFLY